MATAVIILRLIAVLLFAFAAFGFNPFDKVNLVAAALCLWCLATLLPYVRGPWPPTTTTHAHP